MASILYIPLEMLRANDFKIRTLTVTYYRRNTKDMADFLTKIDKLSLRSLTLKAIGGVNYSLHPSNPLDPLT